MRKILIAMLAMATLLASCKREEPVEPVEPQLPVTFTNTAGDWELVSWRGNTVPTTYLRLKNKEFVLWQTVGSMYPSKVTGTYNLVEEEGLGMIIRGLYDYTYEYWEHRYHISSLTATKMEWTSLDDPTDVSLYERTVDFPE